MSTQKKDKKIGGDVKGTPTKVAGGAASKNELRTKLEAILSVPMMKILSQYTEDEVMTLFGKLKDAYDVVHTRTLLLPRDKRLTDDQKALMAAIANEEGGVVEGEEDEEDEDDEMLSQESESDEEEDGKIGEIMQLFKQRLILNEIFERESTHDEDYMDEDELDALEDEEAAEESEEDVPAPKKAAKVTKKGSVKVEELSDEEDDEEDEEEGEFDDEMGDGLAQSRQFFASFSLLDADGNVVASNIELESNDLFTHPGFEGEHSLTWDEDPILTLNTVDGDIIEPEGPSFEELQAALESDEDFDEEILGAGVPNTWDADVAEALKIKAGFPEDLTPLQFIVIMLRVMSRIVKNAARTPGPAPADGLLPYLALELSNHIEEEELAEDAEGMDVDEEESAEESEEEVPAPKKKNAAPAPVKKEQNNKPHHDGKKDHKPHHDGKKDHKPHHDGKKDHKPHHDGKKDHKPHHDGKKDHKPHHDGKKDQKPHHHQNNKDQNNKKRPNITGGHSESTQQHKKHKK